MEKADCSAHLLLKFMPRRNEYEKSIEILKELEAAERRYGLLSCFGLLPSGEVVYFDEGGTPCRVSVQGTALLQGRPLELKNQPVEVISTTEAFKQLAHHEQKLYLKGLAEEQTKQIRWQQSKRRRALRWLASAGFIVLLLSVAVLLLNADGPEQNLRRAEERLKDLYAEQGIFIKGYVDIMVVNTGGYNPLGPVSISRATFKQFLQELNSPALPEADRMYQICVEGGCDPALALAFFEHESNGGNQGVAALTKSIGNIRCTEGYSCYTTEGNGSFRQYATWSEGLRDWVDLLKVYKDDLKRVTLEDIIPKYAPQADNNDETLYIATVKKRVDDLRKREVLNTVKSLAENQPSGNPIWETDWVISQGYSAKHPEIDLARPITVAQGTNIHATLEGVVTVVRDDPLFGNRVFITSSQFTTHYNHLTEDIPVKSGQVVKRGEVIGYMGNSGKSTGPHLDYEIFQGTERANPQDWILRR
ncbi:MAG: M23 family metallopeptidase [Chloroflexi bacterium]|nr:M23 family metallopeptidase [Chloroflexota bacterium]